MDKRKRKELSLQEKVKLINESNGKSQRQLAEQFGIGKTQVHTILKRKADIMEGFENNAANDRKRLCKRSPVEEVNILMWQWFQNVMKQGVRVSGPMLQEKALMYAKELGIPEVDFKASKGWLNRFRDRHNISFQTVCGESGSVSSETVEQWKEKVPDIISGYDKGDIYNMDETGLYFRALPDRTLCVRGDDIKGGKRSKDRLTVMLCVNMKGEFEKPLVIGKSKTPRCFRNLQLDNLPVTWKWNKKAWMTSDIFSEWIKSFNRKMRQQNRNVILFLDNATSHPEDLPLSNVKLQFLPKNTTSVLQPLDQGVLQNMKVHYRKRLIRSVLAKIDSDDSVNADVLAKSVNVLDAVRFISASVKDVKGNTVLKCFVKAGINPESETEEYEQDDVPLAELVELMRTANCKIRTVETMSPEEYISADDEIQVHEELSSEWETDLLNSVRVNSQDCESENLDEDEKDCDESESELVIKSHQEALKCIDNIRMYCFSRGLSDIVGLFDSAQDRLERDSVKALSCSKQRTLDEFFK